jgi:hypothetical protein
VFAVPDEGPSMVRKFAQYYMTCFHIAYNWCHILGDLSYILVYAKGVNVPHRIVQA